MRSGRISARASRSVPPVASTPAGSAGAAGQVVTACAPGQAASTARSTRPGGMMPGTHMLICSPPPAPPVQEYSQPRCGWPCHQRAQAGRSSPVRCPHSASAPAGSACGGARMTTCRAPSASTWWRRRRSHARPAITAAAAAASTGPAAGPHAARACSSSRASRAVVPPGSVTYRPSGPPGPPAAISSRCPVTAACPHQRRRAAAGRRLLRRAAGGLAGGRSRPGRWCTRSFLPARPVPRNRPGRTGRPPGARFPWPPTGAGSVPRRTGGTRRRPWRWPAGTGGAGSGWRSWR